MAKYSFESAGVSSQEVGFVAPTTTRATGLSAAVIGTAPRGLAFVPVVVPSFADFTRKFGDVDGTRFGPLAAEEWLRNASSLTYLRVLGVGDGLSRQDSGDVNRAGFTVGEQQPSGSAALDHNPYANVGGPLGRTYFIGCFMSESAGSDIFSSAGLQGTGSVNGLGASKSVPIVRGILMAPSGVILRLSSSGGGFDSSAPSATLVATEVASHGTTLGSVTLNDAGQSKQEFVLLLNGHSGSTTSPNVITASFDMLSPIYVSSVFNTTASLMQEKGHYLASWWDIHPTSAMLTGTGVVSAGADVPSDANRTYGTERSAFLVTSSVGRDVGTVTVPNYEAFRNRFTYASTPWFTSQKFQGVSHDLFRLHSLHAGSQFSKGYKVTIHDLEPSPEGSPYKGGTFSLSIRDINDPDNEDTRPLETYVNLSLDPLSDTYISKVIGDVHAYYDFDRPVDEQRLVVEGNYPIKSEYVRVEVSDDISRDTLPRTVLPVGFRGISHIVTSGSAPLAQLNTSDTTALADQYCLRNSVVPPLPMRKNNLTAASNKSWGVPSHHIDPIDSNLSYFYGTNRSLEAFSSYFPDNSTVNINFVVGDNVGAPDTTTNGILDADRFCYNAFSLENIRITTGSGGVIDWTTSQYIRAGGVFSDDVAKTRAVEVDDFRSNANRPYLTFTTIFQGGFDGVNIFDADEALMTDSAVQGDMSDVDRGLKSGPTVTSYLKAIEIIKNPTNADIGLLAVPGIRDQSVTDEAARAAEERYDTLYIMDMEQLNSESMPMSSSNLGVDNAPSISLSVANFTSRGVNNSFVATYFPDVVMRPNSLKDKEIVVPPSVVVLGGIAYNDAVGASWLAPAGLRRGLLSTTLTPVVQLDEPSLDLLYKNGINPLYSTTNISQAGVSTSGVVIWGQKTTLKGESPLTRLAVRRLLIQIRKSARALAQQYLFEPNSDGVAAALESSLSSLLSGILNNNGIENFRIALDMPSSNNVNVENNRLSGRIYIQPKKTLEYVTLDFDTSSI